MDLTKSLEKSIGLLRNSNKFQIIGLIYEDLRDHPSITQYFIIYKNDEIISTSRIISSKKSAYINMVFTNPKYRGKKICQNNIQKLIKLTDNFNTYELEVEPDNVPAIKCYESIGFKYVKQTVHTVNNKKIYANLMRYVR